ncbi:APC family permease [Raoultibacter phocaeensis]|uniref:APC family permease n=1 Tax=Raoultibacter phocaeensis TaxID=2479841 RepID=UPI0015D5F520|nr:APC family permease [Raoultibacter phocaeensis]
MTRKPSHTDGRSPTSTPAESAAGLTPEPQAAFARDNVDAQKTAQPPVQKKYGFFTALAMIIGICIGSGIFFKSDNVLAATGGSITLGVVLFCLAAFAIVFGGIAFSELAARTEGPGGLIAYAETFVGRRFGVAVGWFTIFGYLPSIVVVVSWAVGIYTCILFDVEAGIGLQMLIGGGFMVLCFVWNMLAPRFSGGFQNVTTVIKLVPLLLIAFFGLVFGDPIAGLTQHGVQAAGVSLAWIAAIGPVAFSYDGWIVSSAIAPELKNAKKTLPVALVVAPLIILAIYVGYFVGVASFLGPDTVVSMGDGHVFYLAEQLFGPAFARVVAVTVVIAVMGTVNGLTLSFVRMPFALALTNDIPLSRFVKRLNSRFDMPVASGIFALSVSFVWVALHVLTQLTGLLPNSDVSEITIATSYIIYIVLYAKVFSLWREGSIKSRFKGVVAPACATVGSLFICIGSMQNPAFWGCLAASLALCAAGVVYDRFKRKPASSKRIAEDR